jgi:hypothetical protein
MAANLSLSMLKPCACYANKLLPLIRYAYYQIRGQSPEKPEDPNIQFRELASDKKLEDLVRKKIEEQNEDKKDEMKAREDVKNFIQAREARTLDRFFEDEKKKLAQEADAVSKEAGAGDGSADPEAGAEPLGDGTEEAAGVSGAQTPGVEEEASSPPARTPGSAGGATASGKGQSAAVSGAVTGAQTPATRQATRNGKGANSNDTNGKDTNGKAASAGNSGKATTSNGTPKGTETPVPQVLGNKQPKEVVKA